MVSWVSVPPLTRPFALALALAAAWAGCAAPVRSAPHSSRELVMGYDDNRAKEVISFPTATYETVTRFELPEGDHPPLRLRLQVASAGTLAITLYDSTPLESPGEAIVSVTRSIEGADLSDGKDGRWVVENLVETKPLRGIVWVGVRKAGGQPTLWSSGAFSGHSFIRNNDPQNLMGLLPIKHSPMLRLELMP